MVNSDAQTNGETTMLSPQTATKEQPKIDYIELEEDDDIQIEEPPAKRTKPSEPEHALNATPSEQEKKDENLSNYTALLDRLEEHVQKSLNHNTSADRKLLDTLLGAINIQVQKEPYSVRKLILEKQLVLPNSISFPPSQVVDVTIEHDAEMQISKVLTRMFGDERPKLSDAEKRERQHFKNTFPAPAMTRMLMEIGQDLVQEVTYCDIVHAKNLPEVPKNVETYKQVAAQLRPVWENLRDKNASFKLKTYTCKICEFRTENMLLMSVHKQTFHLHDRRIQCGMCPEYNSSGARMQKHYLERHALVGLIPEDPPSKIQCVCCEADFQFKGQRDAHMKTCKREITRLMSIQGSRMPEHSSIVNRWLWSKPPADPTIQQDIQKQQAAKLQQQQRIIPPIPKNAPTVSLPNKPLVSKNQQPTAKGPQMQTPNVSNVIAAIIGNQQLQNQLKNLGPAQQKQLEQLLQSKQNNLPSNVMNAIQSQLRALQTHQQPTAASLAKTLSQASQLGALSNMNPQMLQQLSRTIQAQQQQSRQSTSTRSPAVQNVQRKIGGALPTSSSSSSSRAAPPLMRAEEFICEICDDKHGNKREYLSHLQNAHSVFRDRNNIDLDAGPPLACSRCRERFWSYEGLERHLVMIHSLVTSDLLQKAQNKVDGGKCKQCGKSFAFNILQHLASDHNAKLCSAEILFSCDVCPFKCSSYTKLEEHLNLSHPKNGNSKNGTR